MLKITGLWKSKDKDGKSYLSGNLNQGTRILIFPNNYKKEENHPDYILYLAQVEKKAGGQAQGGSTQPRTQHEPPPPEDDIPF